MVTWRTRHDRLVKGRAEGVEVKCPAPWTQIGYLLDGPGADYQPQVQGQLWVAGFDRVHFYSYHPRMPAVHVETVPDAAYANKLISAVKRFADALDETTEVARSLGAYAAATGFQTPLDEAAPGPEPITLIIP